MSQPSNPYVGPRAFERNEMFYGREREVRGLKALLIAERVVLLHSPSGAGKTSLLRAGLLPAMEEENFMIQPLIRVNTEPPPGAPKMNRYLFSTLSSLEEVCKTEERLPLDELAKLSLDAYLDLRAPKNDLLLIFDQFEEILTASPSDREAKQEFFNLVGEALRDKTRWALFSMREDYLGALAPYVRPLPNRLVTRFRLDLLGDEAAIQAVQKPAKAAGVSFSDDAARKLVDDLRRVQVQLPDGSVEPQLGPYVEPVQLQVVCYRLWEKKNPSDTAITLKDLESVGDVNESLAGYYALSVERVAESSGTPERDIREWFEHKLITPDGIRGQVRMGTEHSDGLPNAVARALENTHITRAEQRGGQTWFELAHDRLIEPVLSDNESWFTRNLSVFQRQAALWLERGRSEGLLLRGLELEKAEQEISKITLNKDEKDFLKACRLRRQREQRDVTQRRIILVSLVVMLVFFFVSVYFGLSAYQSSNEREAALVKANQAATQAYELQVTAELASTQSMDSAFASYTAVAQAYQAQATAVNARNEAVISAKAAATAQAEALTEKNRAEEQKQKAAEQSRLAQANGLVAQALLAENQVNESLANLTAAAAFEVADTPRTRIQLLVSIVNKNLMYMDQTQPSGQTTDLDYAQDGTKLVTSNFFECRKFNFYSCAGGGVVKVWDITYTPNANGSADAILRMEKGQIRPAGMLDASAVSPDGETVATASCNPIDNSPVRCEAENIQFWDIKTLQQVGQTLTLTGTLYNEQAVHLLYSPDGSMVALTYNNPTIFNPNPNSRPEIVLWDTKTYQEISRVPAGNGVTQMAFSQDSKSIAYVSGKTLAIVDLTDRAYPVKKELVSPDGTDSVLLSLAYSYNGQFLAVGTETGIITLLDTTTYARRGAPMTNLSKILVLRFNPNDSILAAGRYDGGISLWDVETMVKMTKRPLFKHVDQTPDGFPIYAIAFSPDGVSMSSTSNEVIIWDMNHHSWLAKACGIAGRNFTGPEWEQNFPGEAYRVICTAFPSGE